jgi:hypothetical protein
MMKKSRHQSILHVFAGCGVLALYLGAGLMAAGPPAYAVPAGEGLAGQPQQLAQQLAHKATPTLTLTPMLTPTATLNPTAASLLALERSIKATQTAQAAPAAPTSTPAAPDAPAPEPQAPATSTPVEAKAATPPAVVTSPRRTAAPLAEVLVDGLNIRSGPGSSYASMGKATAGMLLPIQAQNEGCSWLQVVLEDGGEGWISGNAAYTAMNVACAAIPAAAGDAAAGDAAAGDAAAGDAAAGDAAAGDAAAGDAAAGAEAAVELRLATSTPQPTATAEARPRATAVSSAAASAAPAPAAPESKPGQITSFEPLGDWRRGDEPYGRLVQSNAQVADGRAAAELAYDFPSAAGDKSYVVFLNPATLRIPEEAAALQVQVYGDGAGHFLNTWIEDAQGQTWQLTFGRILHTGWKTMAANLVFDRAWPNGPVGGDGAETMQPPLRLKALVLDGVPDGEASRGTIYLDDLRATSGGSPSASATGGEVNPANTGAGATGGVNGDATGDATGNATGAAGAAAPAAQEGALTGKIAFTRFNGQKMNLLVYDLASGKIVAEMANMRHPDLAGGLLLANGDGGGQETIMRMSDMGGNLRPITMHPEDLYPQWSPSMASLAYASTAYGDRRSRLFYQEDAGAQFEAPPMLYEKRELFGDYPVYLDNWRIAFQGCNTWAGGSKCGIYSADSRGNEPVQATSLTADIPTGNLGSQILFTSNRSGNYDVWVVNWDGSNLRQLTDNPAVDGPATASPDYRHIAFLSNRDGAWAVYGMNADGSNQHKLFDVGGGYGSGEYEWYRERISWGP